MDKYADRQEAGQILAKMLSAYANEPNTLILALPRGGVPVAYEIAKKLRLPLDVFLVRKLGVPGQEELAMGALAMGGISFLNDQLIHDLDISPAILKGVSLTETRELERRDKLYRGKRPFPLLKNKTLILVDDGIATGATLLAAIKALAQSNPAKIIVAVPVAEKSIIEKITNQVAQVVCPLQPVDFYSVGHWYESFEQVSDEEVLALLKL